MTVKAKLGLRRTITFVKYERRKSNNKNSEIVGKLKKAIKHDQIIQLTKL